MKIAGSDTETEKLRGRYVRLGLHLGAKKKHPICVFMEMVSFKTEAHQCYMRLNCYWGFCVGRGVGGGPCYSSLDRRRGLTESWPLLYASFFSSTGQKAFPIAVFTLQLFVLIAL